MSKVPRWAWLAVAAGVLVVVGLGLYLGLRARAEHQVDWAFRLAALDHETRVGQVRQYRELLAQRAADCGMDELHLSASVAAAKRGTPAATAWGLLEAASPSGRGCQDNLLYIGAGLGGVPSSLPD